MSRMTILILLLYTAADPRDKAAVVEKSKKTVTGGFGLEKNEQLAGEGAFQPSARVRKSRGFRTAQSAPNQSCLVVSAARLSTISPHLEPFSTCRELCKLKGV